MTSQTITPFLWEGEVTIRVLDLNGQISFVVADICQALGIVNAADALQSLDDDEKGLGNIYTPSGHQSVVVVSESGIYELIFKSRKPHARKFRKWVMKEVLPSVRRTSAYVTIGDVTGNQRQPWHGWSLEERRLALAEINAARRTLNQGSAAWLWQHIGMPIPPAHLLPAWWQGELLTITTQSNA